MSNERGDGIYKKEEQIVGMILVGETKSGLSPLLWNALIFFRPCSTDTVLAIVISGSYLDWQSAARNFNFRKRRQRLIVNWVMKSTFC